MKTTTARRKRQPAQQPELVTVPSSVPQVSTFDPHWQQLEAESQSKNNPIDGNLTEEEAIAPLDTQDIVQEKTAALEGQKQGSCLAENSEADFTPAQNQPEEPQTADAEPVLQAHVEEAIEVEPQRFQVGDRCWFGEVTNTGTIAEFSADRQGARIEFFHGKSVWLSLQGCEPLTDLHVRNVEELEPGTVVRGQALGKAYEGKFIRSRNSGMVQIEDSTGKERLLIGGTLVRVNPKAEVQPAIGSNAEDPAEPTPIAPEASNLPFTFIADFLTPEEADRLLEQSEALDWQNNTIRMYGKRIPLPRLEAMFGDAGCSYTYSNSVLLEPQPWTEPLQLLRDRIQQQTGSSYQVVIGNQYRDGSDHIGWHSDDSPEMGRSPAIASISLGATRHFRIRNKATKETHDFELTHGSLLVMHPGCQSNWVHCITKTSKDVGKRINWTFRPHTGGVMQVSSGYVDPQLPDEVQIVQSEVVELTESDRLIESLYEALKQAEDEANTAFKRATGKYFDLGIELLKRRPEFKRGSWLPWLAERGIDERYAQRAMQIAKHFGEKSDSLSDMSIEDALRQIQKKLPSVDGYEFDEVKAEYDSIKPDSFKFHSVGQHPYTFEVQGFTACFNSLTQAMNRLPALREKYGRIADYQAVDVLPEPEKEAIAESDIEQVAPSGWIQTRDGRNLNPRHYEVVADEQSVLDVEQGAEEAIAPLVPVAVPPVAAPKTPTAVEVLEKDEPKDEPVVSKPIITAAQTRAIAVQYSDAICNQIANLGLPANRLLNLSIMDDLEEAIATVLEQLLEA